MPRPKSARDPDGKGPIKKASILRGPNNMLKVIFTYMPEAVEDIKVIIPYGHRKWDPDAKCWWVSEMYLEELVAILKKHYGDEITTDLEGEDTVENPFTMAFEALPAPHVDKIYRAFAQAVHPDVGGSDDLMKKLNDAYAKVKNKAMKP